MGAIGLMPSTAPCRVLPGTGPPLSSRGVWQSPHMPTPSAIYLPRATFADCVGDAEEGKAEIIARMESTAIATPARPDLTEFFMLSLQAERILHRGSAVYGLSDFHESQNQGGYRGTQGNQCPVFSNPSRITSAV